MITRKSPELVSVTCSFDQPSAPVDAGRDLSLMVRFTCVPACDLEGETVELIDENGVVVGSASIGPFDEAAEVNEATLIGPVPATAGRFTWSVRLPEYQDDEVRYEAVTEPVTFDVQAHDTTVLVWDVPTAVVPGKRFSVKVGVKCSGGCSQAGREVSIVDHEGTVLATAAPTDLWPKSEGLYFSVVELPAPSTPGDVLAWQARCAADREAEEAKEPLPHQAGSAKFDVRTIKSPEVRVRIETWDAKQGIPLPGTRVVMHPYSAVTDERGVAEVEVARGHYRLFASRPKYTTFGTPVEVSGDLSTRIELHVAPPPNRE